MLGIHNAKTSKIIVNDKKKYISFKSLHQAIDYETDIFDLNASQIFTHGPQTTNQNKYDGVELKKLCKKKAINLYVHGSYLSTAIWKVSTDNQFEPKSILRIQHIVDMMQSCIETGAQGLVIHLQKNTPEEIAETFKVFQQFQPYIELIELAENAEEIPTLLLEMPARKSDKATYETAKKINSLTEMLDSINTTIKWGWCLDTAHMWSGGINFSPNNSWKLWSSKLSKSSREKINMIHLNGALQKNFDTGKDKHIIPLSPDDGIWSHIVSEDMDDIITEAGKLSHKKIANFDFIEKMTEDEIATVKSSSFADIINFANELQIPMILEINCGDFVNAKFCIDIINMLLNKL